MTGTGQLPPRVQGFRTGSERGKPRRMLEAGTYNEYSGHVLFRLPVRDRGGDFIMVN